MTFKFFCQAWSSLSFFYLERKNKAVLKRVSGQHVLASLVSSGKPSLLLTVQKSSNLTIKNEKNTCLGMICCPYTRTFTLDLRYSSGLLGAPPPQKKKKNLKSYLQNFIFIQKQCCRDSSNACRHLT